MDPLADIDDLTARLPAGSVSDAARAIALIADVSAAIRRYTGQQFTQDTTTDRVKAHKGKVRPPQRPITAVTSVVDLNGVAITHTLVNDVIHLDTVVPDTWAWEPRRTALGYVDVTYTHGYETLPDDLIGFVCQVVGRAYATPSTDGGVQSETMGAYSYTTGAAAAAGVFGLLPAERAWLDLFMRTGGVIYVSQ